MALFVASLANVSWQGINPPGAGGDPRVYPATTLAALVAWPPESRRSPRGPCLSQLSDPDRSNTNAAESWSDCPCFDPQLAQIM